MSYDELVASTDSKRQFVLGVTGFVPEKKYESMLGDRQFGLEMGTEMHPYTSISYWSVADVTRSMIVLALAKYSLIGFKEQA
jgi:hypothetical protein